MSRGLPPRPAALTVDSLSAVWSETNDIGRQRLRLLEVRPLRLAQQFELELQDIAQRQAANGVCDQRLFGQHVVHVSETPPCIRRRHDRARPDLIPSPTD